VLRKALFLDRDGVINLDHGYVCRVEQFEWLEGVFDTVRAAAAGGLLTIVVTNQAGIARGYYTEAAFRQLTDWMLATFAASGAPVTAVYHCPYHPDGIGPYRVADHPDRKPNPGMLLRAAREHDLDLGSSLLAGDQETDVEAGIRAGVGATARFGVQPGGTDTRADVAVPGHRELAEWIRRRTGQPLPQGERPGDSESAQSR
jgi:D-glycero-D-manno-heptose 1,7-bisphosphate phosphatase